MKECPNCGSFLDESAKFCNDCGNPLDLAFKNEMGNLLKDYAQDIKNPSTQGSVNDLEFLGLECLKCGSQSSLTLFTHSETVSTEHKRSTSYRTRSIKVPVCNICDSDLHSWTSKHSSGRMSYYNVVCYTIIAVAFGIGMMFSPIPIISFFIWFFLALTYIYVFRKRSQKNQAESPHRYIKFRGNRTFVRPRGEGPWIRYDDWLKPKLGQNQQF